MHASLLPTRLRVDGDVGVDVQLDGALGQVVDLPVVQHHLLHLLRLQAARQQGLRVPGQRLLLRLHAAEHLDEAVEGEVDLPGRGHVHEGVYKVRIGPVGGGGMASALPHAAQMPRRSHACAPAA